MIVSRDPSELPAAERAVAIGTFDGVHRGHRQVIERALGTGLRSTVVTFHPHPREVLGYEVHLLSTFERRLELIEAIGPDDILVVEFTAELSRVGPEQFAREVLEPIGTRVVFSGENFRFGRGRSGDPALLRELGFEVEAVPLVQGVSASRIREALRAGDVNAAARMLGRPAELEGLVVTGESRGVELGFPTANLAVPAHLLVPGRGIYAGSALGRRAAISIGVNPHYGGHDQRVEAYLLGFEGDLYGRHLRLELWERLRDERAFESEQALVEQIARDVERTRAARRPV
jgi:riboflavin kinase/FMN adenylyltransferase